MLHHMRNGFKVLFLCRYVQVRVCLYMRPKIGYILTDDETLMTKIQV